MQGAPQEALRHYLGKEGEHVHRQHRIGGFFWAFELIIALTVGWVNYFNQTVGNHHSELYLLMSKSKSKLSTTVCASGMWIPLPDTYLISQTELAPLNPPIKPANNWAPPVIFISRETWSFANNTVRQMVSETCIYYLGYFRFKKGPRNCCHLL